MSMYLSFILIPVISAFIAWLSSYIGIKFLLNNYLPNRKKVVAMSIAKEVKHLIPINNIEEKIKNGNLIEKAMPGIEKHIDDFLNVKLQQEIPMLAIFIGNKTTDKVKDVFINQLRELFPQVMGNMLDDLKETLDVEKIIIKKMEEVDIKSIIASNLSKPINKLQLFGILVGFIIGIINILIFRGFQ